MIAPEDTKMKTTLFALSLLVAGTFGASAGMDAYPGITKSAYWSMEACGNDPRAACEAAFRRLCGKTPNAACVKRNQKAFDRASRGR